MKSFFKPIPVTMTSEIKGRPTDDQLLEAWKDVPDQNVRYPVNKCDPKSTPIGFESQDRIRRLRGLA